MRLERWSNETRTLQVWPSGQGFTIQGNPDADPRQRRLRRTSYNGEPRQRWRKGTKDEWRQIRIEVRAEMYGNRDILGCDSSLVGDLIKAANSGELSGDLASGFAYEEIQNLTRDCSNFDADDCRSYASDHGIDLPDIPEDEPEYETDDSRYGWLSEAREACQEYANENQAEVYEWWRVSSWLCGQLKAIGEVVIDNGYGYWWGRQGTGQQWIMDGTLQQIAALYEDR